MLRSTTALNIMILLVLILVLLVTDTRWSTMKPDVVLANEDTLLYELDSFSPATEENKGLILRGHIGGRINKVTIQGDYAYFVSGPKVLVFDISEPTQVAQVGQTSVMLDIVENLAVAGNYLYTANGKSGIYIFDITDPTNPTNVTSIDTPVFATDIDAQSIGEQDYAFVADGTGGLRVIKVTTPDAPSEVGNIESNSFDLRSIIVDDNYAYATNWSGTKVEIIDISTPEDPVKIGNYDSPSYPFGLDKAGQLLYVADRDYGLRVVDVSDPDNPYEIGGLDTSGQTYDIRVSTTHAYLADIVRGVTIINIEDPELPQEVGSYDETTYGVQGLAISGNHVFAADGLRGLQVIDVTSPSTPFLADLKDLLGSVLDVSILDGIAYVAADARGIVAVNVSSPEDPIALGFYTTSEGRYKSINADGNFVYTVDTHCCPSKDNFEVIDITDPTNMVRIGGPESTVYAGPGRAIVVSEDRAYIAKIQGGLVVFNVAQPEDPFLEGSFMTDPSEGSFYDVEIVDNKAYLPDADGGVLRIVNTTNPYLLHEIGSVEILSSGSMYSVVEKGAYVFLDRGRYFHIVDVQDPSNPETITTYELQTSSGAIQDIQLIGQYAFLHLGTEVRIIDILHPHQPIDVGRYNLFSDFNSTFNGVHAAGNYLYVYGGAGGLYILEWSGPFQLELPFRDLDGELSSTQERFQSHATATMDHNKPFERYDGKMLPYLGYISGCDTASNPESCEYDADPGFSWPNVACGESITDCYPGHEGVDFSQRDTDGFVYAAASGVVESTSFLGGYGNTVIVDHGNGFITRYSHLERIDVSEGQEVTIHTQLGLIGATGGDYITGEHIHFELKYDDGFNRYLLDPSGWKDNANADPWVHPTGLKSFHMWAFEMGGAEEWSIDGDAGGMFTSLSGTSINIAAGEFSGLWNFVYSDIPLANPSNKLLPTGHSFTVEGVESTRAETRAIEDSGQFMITIPYSNEELTSIDETSLGIYVMTVDSEEWTPIATDLDMENDTATIITSRFGLFALLGDSDDYSLYLPAILR